MLSAERPILHVENEPDEIFFLTRALKKAEIVNPLKGVQNGEEAIDYLLARGRYENRALHPLPALVLLDLNMPLMNGFEVLKWRAAIPVMRAIPVIVLTSSRQHRDVMEAYQLGANAYLVKPSATEELSRMAHALKVFWLTHAEVPVL